MLAIDAKTCADLVAKHLRSYAKDFAERELDAWFEACKPFSLDQVQRALDAHADHPEDGKRAARPVDVIRRIRGSASDSRQCSTVDANSGRCDYPGVFSDNTNGAGPWFCPWHRQVRTGPDAVRMIEASREIPFAEARQRQFARMAEESNRSPSVIALRARMEAHRARFSTREPGADEGEEHGSTAAV